VNEVRELRHRFPNSAIAVITQYLTNLFIHRVCYHADVVFSTQATEKDDDSWTDFAIKLRRVTRE